jgi:hypothetical protein
VVEETKEVGAETSDRWEEVADRDSVEVSSGGGADACCGRAVAESFSMWASLTAGGCFARAFLSLLRDLRFSTVKMMSLDCRSVDGSTSKSIDSALRTVAVGIPTLPQL